MKPRPDKILAVLFDMDGTITRPYIDFPTLRAAMGVPADANILDYLASLDPEPRERAGKILADFERDAAHNSELNEGARELLDLLRARAIPAGIITRNNPDSVRIVCAKHSLSFDVVVTADDAEPKPSPEPVLLAARKLGVDPRNTLMVGDYLFDVQSGNAAGSHTVLVTNGRPCSFEHEADLVVESLLELIPLLDGRTPCPRAQDAR